LAVRRTVKVALLIRFTRRLALPVSFSLTETVPLPFARPPPTFLPPRSSAPETVHADGHGTLAVRPFRASA
jgi:hypothetical protein